MSVRPEDVMEAAEILVVDDDLLFRWSLSEVLCRAGYRVEEAARVRDITASALHACAKRRRQERAEVGWGCAHADL